MANVGGAVKISRHMYLSIIFELVRMVLTNQLETIDLKISLCYLNFCKKKHSKVEKVHHFFHLLVVKGVQTARPPSP